MQTVQSVSLTLQQTTGRMLENTEELGERDARSFLPLFPKAKGIFAVEDNKKDCIEKLEEADPASEPRMEVKALMTKVSPGRRASADLCCDKARDPFFHASGRCGLYRRQCGDAHSHYIAQ